MNTRRTAVLILALALATALVLLGAGSSSVKASPQGEPAELEEFIPSEELPADSAVAFPVDI